MLAYRLCHLPRPLQCPPLRSLPSPPLQPPRTLLPLPLQQQHQFHHPLWHHAYCGLTYLNLTENLLSGSILRSLANIPGLRLLDLSYNSLSDGFPVEFARFASLEFFSVLSNLMNRTVPGFLSNVTSLRHLQLDRFALILLLFFTLSLLPFSLSLSLSTVVSTHHILSLFPILSQP